MANLPISIVKKLESFGFVFFVDDVISGVILGIFTEVISPWVPTARANFLTQLLVEARL